jgi:hypothetical protein
MPLLPRAPRRAPHYPVELAPVCQCLYDRCAVKAESRIRVQKRMNSSSGQQQRQTVQPWVHCDLTAHSVARHFRHRQPIMLAQAARDSGKESLWFCRQYSQADLLRVHQFTGMRPLGPAQPGRPGGCGPAISIGHPDRPPRDTRRDRQHPPVLVLRPRFGNYRCAIRRRRRTHGDRWGRHPGDGD